MQAMWYIFLVFYFGTPLHTHSHTHSYTHVCALFAGIKIRDITLRVAHVSHTKLYLTLPSPYPCLLRLCALSNDKQIYYTIYTTMCIN